MDIKNLSDLAKIINLCRKKGIEVIKIRQDEIELTFSEPVQKKQQKLRLNAADTSPVEPLPEGPSQEELLFWSSMDPLASNELKS